MNEVANIFDSSFYASHDLLFSTFEVRFWYFISASQDLRGKEILFPWLIFLSKGFLITEGIETNERESHEG